MNRRERRAGLAFARATRGEWHPFERVDLPADALRRAWEGTGDLVSAHRNNVFSVQIYLRARAGALGVLHLAVRRHDGEEVRGWSDLQRIKNELCGEGCAALEVYPPDSEVVDQANMRHLFVLPEGEEAPFTIRGRWT